MMETFSTGQSPFREETDKIRFFPGGSRRVMLESLKSALVESVSLVTLTGDEGSGKTMLCHMLVKELPEGYVHLFFPDMLESFEDVTRAVAQRMNITLADGIATGDVRELLLEVWERLSERKQKMLLIFDQAEKIYLATLERIRKMLDIVNQTGIKFQILLSGGSGLLDNLEQLSMCNFKGAEEKKVFLGPLDSSATYAYLNFCMRGEGDHEVFSLETSEKIFLATGGNLRKTNLLAEEVLQSQNPDSSFMVLPDNVRDSFSEKQGGGWDLSFMKELYLTYKQWVVPAGACLAALLLILLWWGLRSPQVQEKKPAPEIEKTLAEFRNVQKNVEEIERKVERVKAGKASVADKEVPKKEETVSTSSQNPRLTVEDITMKQSVETKSIKTPTAASGDVSHVTKPENTTLQKPPLSKKEQKSLVEKIFTDRTAAAAKWLVGRKNTHYTIQLMVLASEGAESNLKKMLAKKDYQDLSDNLFIFRRATSTPSILVFFGEYSTMIDARNATKALPNFLLKHNPYAISIRGAIEKAIGG